MDKITILGGQGFIGTHLCRYLESNGYNFWAPERDDESIFTKPLGYIIYCIGLTNDFQSRIYDTVDAHVSYLAKILAQANFSALLYLSSTRLYDNTDKPIVNENDSLQLDPKNPRHIYDLSKALGESLCLHATTKQTYIARLSCVYSHELHSPGFLPSLIKSAREQNLLTLEASLASARDYIHINDVIKSCLAILNSGRERIYNVASGINISNANLFHYIEQNTNCQIRASHNEAPPSPIINIDRLRNEFGIHIKSLFDTEVIHEAR